MRSGPSAMPLPAAVISKVIRQIDPERNGWMYFIGPCVEGAPIKIGFTTKDPDERCAQLQTGHPEELSVLLAVPASKAFESAMHEELREFRVRGEWFEHSAVYELFAHLMRVPKFRASAWQFRGLLAGAFR